MGASSFPDLRSLIDLLLTISRIARSRRETARDSYRSSLTSSGSALRTASAVRSGSWVGIVAEGSTRSGRAGGALPDKIDLRYRISLAKEPKSCGASSAPSPDARSIRATLTCLTRARSSSACAAARACSRTISSLLPPAIFRVRFLRCFAIAALEMLKVRPWVWALWLDRFLPVLDRGPMLSRALLRFAAICRSLATG